MLNGWNDWVPLEAQDGTEFSMPTSSAGKSIPLQNYALTVIPNAIGCLHVFCIGQDGNLWHIQQTAPNSPWGPWNMIGNPNNLTLVPSIAVAMNAGRYLEAFVMSNKGQILHTYELATPSQNTPSNPNASSPQWNELIGMPQLQGVQAGTIAAVANGNDGHLEVFVAGSAASPQGPGIYHCYQTAPNNGWIADFVLLQGNLVVAAIVAALNYGANGVNGPGNTVELFILGGQPGSNKPVSLWHLYQMNPGAGPWSPLFTLASPFPTGMPGAPCVGMTRAGALQVFAVDQNGNLQQTTQGGGGSPDGWSQWSNTGQLINCAQSYGTPILLARSCLNPGLVSVICDQVQLIFALQIGAGNLIDGVQFEVGTSPQAPTTEPPSAMEWAPGLQSFLGGGQASCLAVGMNQFGLNSGSRSEVFIIVNGSLRHTYMQPNNKWVTGVVCP